MKRAMIVMVMMAGNARADVTQTIKGATVDWSEGTMSAVGIGPADRHAPAPAVARDAALARAQAAARASLIAAAKALPGAHDLDDAALAQTAARAVIVTEDVGTDGSVTVQLAIPIEAVRVAMAGPRAAAPAIESVPPAVIVDATHVKVKPQLGVTIGGWRGPVLFVDKPPAEDDPRTGDHPAHRIATKAAAGAITIDGDPPAAGALAVVVMTGEVMKRIALVVLLALGASRAARAEDVATYETDGNAAAALTDARTRALDVAFAAAVTSALADLVAPADLTSFRGDLDRVIVGRARTYVASFKVTAEETRGDELHVSAAVKIDRDRVRAKLAELGVPIKAAGTSPVAVPAAAPKAIVLLRIDQPSGVIASYGAAAVDSVPGLEGVWGVLRDAGVAAIAAPRSGPAAHAGGELPLDDDSARALAGDAKAGMVVIVGVTIEGAGAVRGVRAEGASAIAHVRILEGDRVSGEGSARAGAYSSEDAGAIARAATMAAVAAVAAAMPRSADGAAAPPAPPPPPLRAEAGTVLVRLRGLAAWTPIKSITAQLAQTSGVDKVVMMRVAAGEVVLAVSTKQKAERIAAAIRATEGFTGRAATDDGVVEVTP